MDIKTMIEIAAMLLTAGAIYGAIRGDIKNIHEKVKDVKEDVKSVKEASAYAHRRIDDILLKGTNHGD